MRKHNRREKTKPKYGWFWCHGCDRQLIHVGQKCPVCGKKDLSKHQKK